MAQLPEGFELNVIFYVKSDQGLTARLVLGGKTDDRGIADGLNTMDAETEFLKGLGEQYGGKWRPMTREEIRQYKEDEADDE